MVSLGTGLAYLSSFSLRGVPSILLPSAPPHPYTPGLCDVYVLCENWPREMRVVGGEGLPIPSSGSPLVALGSGRGACSWICPGRPRSRLANFRRPLGSIVLWRLGSRSWAMIPAWERKRGCCELVRRMETLSVVHRFRPRRFCSVSPRAGRKLHFP